jgi:hypothetical protein
VFAANCDHTAPPCVLTKMSCNRSAPFMSMVLQKLIAALPPAAGRLSAGVSGK